MQIKSSSKSPIHTLTTDNKTTTQKKMSPDTKVCVYLINNSTTNPNQHPLIRDKLSRDLVSYAHILNNWTHKCINPFSTNQTKNFTMRGIETLHINFHLDTSVPTLAISFLKDPQVATKETRFRKNPYHTMITRSLVHWDKTR